MLRHKYTTPLCIGIVVIMLLATVLFVFGESFGLSVVQTEMPYVESLFATDRVHTLDIVVDEESWQEMLDNAADKEYIPANIVLDGKSVKNIGLRTKGNSSLSSIVSSDSDRYSFKIEFDHYQTGQTYYGLDKLALNNIVQDNTYLKDYISYQMMNEFDADSPLCSFIYITVNGEDWGLYLAVEGIEEAYASRNYGSDYGQIYKPDSMNMMGGGGGNRNNDENGEMPQRNPQQQNTEETVTAPAQISAENQTDTAASANRQNGPGGGRQGGGPGGGGMGGGMGRGSTDVALVYSDDEYESYSNIFDNAAFDITNTDKDRLISTLKQLSEGEDLEEIVNIQEVLRYFVVHNFVLNFDSYTGSMMHNYYLYEKDGMLSMIAWDYNLAFGAFSGGGGNSQSGTDSTTALINYPIDTPVSGTTLEDRPLLGKLLENETYLNLYHQLFGEFISSYFESGEFEQMIDSTISLIAPYVEKDPTAFCTYEEFTEASAMLKSFCLLRAESVQGQLDGSIPSTSEGQAADSRSLIDASAIDIKSMGSNGGGQNARSNDQSANAQEGETTFTPGDLEGSEQPNQAAFAPGGLQDGYSSQDQASAEKPMEDTSQDAAPTEENQASARGAPPNGGGQNGGQGGGPPGNAPQGFGGQQKAASGFNTQHLYYLLAALLLLTMGIVLANRFRVHR
ncbi:CotH kinase family protein [Oscillospiraceae bacterium MB08-C2-2]|nr:CotH kinase family protein [Oscillospiraceae bacterium MB08-C2-2]